MRLNVSVSIVQLVDLSVKDEKIEIMTWMYMHWFDEYLTWHPADYGNITETVVPAEEMWKPDFYLYNSVHQTKWNARVNTPMKLSHNGKVHWSSPATFAASCNANSEFYPIDSQNCSLWFATWTHTANLLDAYNLEDNATTAYYVEADDWKLLSSKARRETTKYVGEEYGPDGLIYVNIYYDLVYKRARIWGIINFIAPCILLCVILMFVFLLPANCGEKVSFASMTFLTFMLANQLISAEIPRSDTTPLISNFLKHAMILNTLSLSGTVVVLVLYHSEDSFHMTRWYSSSSSMLWTVY